MRVLVTGATSLIGRQVVSQLLERGDTVRTLQRSAIGDGRVDDRRGDISDPSSLVGAFDACDAVVHLAARVGVTGPWEAFESTNVHGTAHVLEAAHRAHVGAFVHVSSPSVAHAGDSLVGARAMTAEPDMARGHYSRSKAMAEQLALAADADSMAVTALRPHLVWGPGDEQLVGRIVERAKAGRLATIGTGAVLIDTTYVDNAAAALVAALHRIEHVRGRPWVVSNGQPRPVAEVIAAILSAAGLDPPRLSVPLAVARSAGLVIEKVWERTGRTEDPPMTGFVAEQLGTAHWFDQRETRAALAWRPLVSLEEGLRRLEAWFASGGSNADTR